MSPTDQHRIIILEKNQGRRDYLKSIISGRGYVPFIFEKETICLDNLISLQPDLVISGPLSNNRIFRFVNTVKMMDGSLPVLIVSGDQSMKDFATSNGFGDVKVLRVNFELSEIKGAISNLIRNRYAKTGSGDQESPLIIGNNPEILRIKKRISELNSLNEPVLIQGEPGAGKELVARAIHHQSERCSRPFTKAQLAKMNPDLLDEIIFNFEQDGSLKPDLHPSDSNNPIDGGTLFLAEVAALPASDQSRLLAVFEKGGLPEVIENRTLKGSRDAAIIVSSSSFLDELVTRGKFRKDLYYRISVVSINIPPLRKRVGDIPLLTDFFADQFCMKYGAGHIELPKKIKDSFCRYPWPGNVRELKSIVRRVVLYGEKDSVIQNFATQWARNPNPLNLDEEIYALAGLSKVKKYIEGRDNPTLKNVRSAFLLKTEKAVIKKALEKTNWNRKKAAGILDISYKSLLNKIKKYRLA